MAYEFLKKLFGTPKEGEAPKAMTYEELEKAIDADKGISLVNLKDGGYVSKDKFDASETELSGVKQQLTDANAQIKALEGQDAEGLKKSIADWETKYNTDTKKLQEQIASQERSYAENLFLTGYQFTSNAARRGVLDELREKNFKIENGQLQGAKDFMDGLMKNEDYKGAFKVEEPETGGEGTQGKGADGAGGNGGQQQEGGFQSTSGNIYTGAQPRFSAGTNGGVGTGGEAPKFNFGFTHIREPETK